MSVGARQQRIDAIRGVAILLVLLNHFNIAYRLDALRLLARNGNYGVTLFFVVSGFLITSNAYRRWGRLAQLDARAFYTLRVARIVPCLVLLVVVADVLAWSGLPVFASRGVPVWLLDVASLTFWMNVLIGRLGWADYCLGVLWSLSVEEVFYLAFPILCRTVRAERWLLALWSVAVLVGPLYRMAHQGDEAAYLYGYLACLDGIAIGCGAALLMERRPGWARHANAPGIAGATVAAMVVLYVSGPIGQTNVLGVTAMALGAAVLVVGSPDAQRWMAPDAQRWMAPAAQRWMTPLRWMGRLSYELYLFHLLVLGTMRTLWPAPSVPGAERVVLLVMFLAASAALASGVARWFADPVNRLIRRQIA